MAPIELNPSRYSSKLRPSAPTFVGSESNPSPPVPAKGRSTDTLLLSNRFEQSLDHSHPLEKSIFPAGSSSGQTSPALWMTTSSYEAYTMGRLPDAIRTGDLFDSFSTFIATVRHVAHLEGWEPVVRHSKNSETAGQSTKPFVQYGCREISQQTLKSCSIVYLAEQKKDGLVWVSELLDLFVDRGCSSR